MSETANTAQETAQFITNHLPQNPQITSGNDLIGVATITAAAVIVAGAAVFAYSKSTSNGKQTGNSQTDSNIEFPSGGGENTFRPRTTSEYF